MTVKENQFYQELFWRELKGMEKKNQQRTKSKEHHLCHCLSTCCSFPVLVSVSSLFPKTIKITERDDRDEQRQDWFKL